MPPKGDPLGAATEARPSDAPAGVRASAAALANWMRSPAGIVLILLCSQSVSIALLMRFSKTMEREESAGPAYLSTAAIFLSEILKLPICIFMAWWTTRKEVSLWQLLRDEIWAKPVMTMKTGVPAFAYTVQGNLILVAVANLEAPVYQVIYQCKTLFTALFSRLFLSRVLEYSQWMALFVLVAGMVTAVLATNFSTSASTQQNVLTGLVSLVIVGLLSAGASVYFEKMLKTEIEGPAKAAGLWLRNIQLGLFALPLSAGAMLLNDWDQVREYGILQGFDNVVVWLVVLLIGAGGLLVAATMKYADNIVKCFATAIAIVLDIVLSIPIFHFIPSWSFIVGAPLVIVATVLYSLAPKNVFGLDDMDCPNPCPCFGGAGDKPKATTRPANETNKLLPGGGETSPLGRTNTFREKARAELNANK
jgi:UDP-sugar transporter A1/2/3